MFGDLNCPCLKYRYNKEGIYEPFIDGPENYIESQDEDSNEQNKEGKAAERALPHKIISIADVKDLEQIIEQPTFRRPRNKGKSHLERIFTDIPDCTEPFHMETKLSRNNVLTFDL